MGVKCQLNNLKNVLLNYPFVVLLSIAGPGRGQRLPGSGLHISAWGLPAPRLSSEEHY